MSATAIPSPAAGRLVHAAAATMIACIVASLVATVGPDPRAVLFVLAMAVWNAAPVAAWWAWATDNVRRGRTGRVSVVGAMLVPAVAVAYTRAPRAGADGQGGLIYLSLPVVLAAGLGAVLAATALIARALDPILRDPPPAPGGRPHDV